MPGRTSTVEEVGDRLDVVDNFAAAMTPPGGNVVATSTSVAIYRGIADAATQKAKLGEYCPLWLSFLSY